MSAYIYAAKMRILTTLAYRFEVFSSLGTNLILMIASVFLWQTAYKGIDVVNGINESQIITYAIIASMIYPVMTCRVQDTINDRIREGNIAVDFIRPSSLLLFYLADDIGNSVSKFVNRLIPLLVFASVFIKIPLPKTPLTFVVFSFSCILSYGILWLLSALVGLLSFWVIEIGNLGIVKDALLRILSGSLVPIWFFPKIVQSISNFLPFIYTYQMPISIYIGRLTTKEIIRGIVVQFIWVLVLYVMLRIVWNKAKKRVLVQGG